VLKIAADKFHDLKRHRAKTGASRFFVTEGYLALVDADNPTVRDCITSASRATARSRRGLCGALALNKYSHNAHNMLIYNHEKLKLEHGKERRA
jgi:hypothetical protein